MNDFERQWSTAMKKATQQIKNQIPLDIQKKQNKEEMLYFKEELKKSLYNKDKNGVQKNLAKLIETKAKQLSILFHFLEAEGALSDFTAKKYIKKYYEDCVRLIKVVGRQQL